MNSKKTLALIWYMILLVAQVYVIFFFDGFVTYAEKEEVRYPMLIFFVFYVLIGLILFVLPLFKKLDFNFKWVLFGLGGFLILAYPFTNHYLGGINFDGYHYKQTNYYFDDTEDYRFQADTDVFLRYYTAEKKLVEAEGYFTNRYNTVYTYDLYDCEVVLDPELDSELTEKQAEVVYNRSDFYTFTTAPIGTENTRLVSCYFGEDFKDYDTYYIYYTENNKAEENIFIMPPSVYDEVLAEYE